MGRRHALGAAAERPEVLTDVLITGIHASGAGIARLSDSSNSRDVPEILVPGALPGARGDLFWNPPKPGGHWVSPWNGEKALLRPTRILPAARMLRRLTASPSAAAVLWGA